MRLGLIGSGWIGAFHAETISNRVPGAVLEAVADPTPGAADRVAAPLGVTKTYLDAADLLADDQVDGVVISSPAFTHAEIVVAAAGAGKAVFVEKPMALTHRGYGPRNRGDARCRCGVADWIQSSLFNRLRCSSCCGCGWRHRRPAAHALPHP
nr:Gfo/Idh/MocA family oxidoreductase [Nesterenkonia muleiensis]